MKKQIWEIGGMNSVFPQKIDTQEIATQEEYLVFEILEDGTLGHEGVDSSFGEYRGVFLSKDKKVWINTSETETVDVKSGEIWYCKGDLSPNFHKIVDHYYHSMGEFIGSAKFNVSGNINSIFNFPKYDPKYDNRSNMLKIIAKLMNAQIGEVSDEMDELMKFLIEILNNYSPEEAIDLLMEIMPELGYMIKSFTSSIFLQYDINYFKQWLIEQYRGNHPTYENWSDDQVFEVITQLSDYQTFLTILSETETLIYFAALHNISLISTFSSTNIVDASKLIINNYNLIYTFHNCEFLTKSPAVECTVAGTTYAHVFSNCHSLKEVTFLNIPDVNVTVFYAFMNGVSTTGTFIKKKDIELPDGIRVPSGWEVVEI